MTVEHLHRPDTQDHVSIGDQHRNYLDDVDEARNWVRGYLQPPLDMLEPQRTQYIAAKTKWAYWFLRAYIENSAWRYPQNPS